MRWLVVLSLVAGCFRDAPAPPANRVQGERRASGDVLAYLPADADIVVSFDVPRVRANAVWQSYEEAVTRGTIAKVKATCGIDPGAVQRFTFAIHGFGTDQPEGVFVLRGLPRDGVMKCIVDPRLTSEKIAVVGDVITMIEPEQSLVGTFVDARTLVVLVKKGANAAALDAVVRSGAPLRGSPAFADMLARTDTGATLWVVALGHSKTFDGFRSLGYPVTAASASIHSGDGFELTARMRMESPTGAQQLLATLKSQIGPLQALVESIDVGEEDDDVKIDVKLTDSQLDRLIAMLGLARSLHGP